MDGAKIITEHYPDTRGFGFFIRASLTSHWMNWKLYKVASLLEPDDQPYFRRAGASGSEDQVPDVALAEPWAEGHIKWDGCQEWEFDHLHFCGSAMAAEQFALAVEAVRATAEKHMPNYGPNE